MTLDRAIEIGAKGGNRMTSEELKIFCDAIHTFGMQKQILMVFEEMAELQKELCKYLRNGESDEAVCRVAEELADVEIMLDQMKLLFGTGRVQREREKKVQRLRARLDAQAGSAQRRSIPWEAD